MICTDTDYKTYQILSICPTHCLVPCFLILYELFIWREGNLLFMESYLLLSEIRLSVVDGLLPGFLAEETILQQNGELLS